MIAVVVVNYHSEDRTIAFVKDELSKIKTPHVVLIVDNGSTKESEEALRSSFREDDPAVVIIPSKENLGFARGNNLGVEYARNSFHPDFILFSNNDIRFVEDDLVERLISKLSDVSDAAVIGPKVVGLDGRLDSPSPFSSFFDRHVLLYWSNLFWSQKKRTEKLNLDYSENAKEGFHYLVSGCFFLVRAADYYSCGGMDPNTFLYGEEMILSERLKSIGKGVYYFPEVSVRHEHGATTGRYYNRVKIRKMVLESEIYYYRTYIGTPNWQFLLARFTLLVKQLLRR